MATKKGIIDSIRGQKVVIPDLESVFSDWPKGRSIEEAGLRHDVSEHLNRYVYITPSRMRYREAVLTQT